MNTIKGSIILDELVEQLNIDLPSLVAGCAFWSPVSAEVTKAVYPKIKRARAKEERGTVTADGTRFDDNTYANKVLKDQLSHLGKFKGFAVCHIWPQTCYDERYHTMPANLVLLPQELASLTDHNRAVEQCLQYRAWELYRWYPEGKMAPEKPANYPDSWREPEPKPISRKRPDNRASRTAQNGRVRDVLPMVLDPSNSDVFRSAFIKRGKASVSIHYKDGRVEDDEWLCQRFGPLSSVIGNLRSKKKFRSGMWQQNGIEKVCVKVPCEEFGS